MIQQILDEREKTHGDFHEVAKTFEALISAIPTEKLSAMTLLSINVILQKVARIVNGDQNFEDHWRDISGYAELCCRGIIGK
jgi:hypothetical protein